MKAAVTALGMLAAVASAYSPGRRHLHFSGNGTETLTTLTIKTTQLHTVISCAPTVTNCPAHATAIATLPDSQKVTKVITDTIVLATTVCPVNDVAKASSSAIAMASTNSIPALTTNANASSAEPAMATKVTDVVTDKTYTITMGTGPAASVATRTLRTTIQKTITVPCTDATAAPVSTSEPSEPTTTTTATTRVTRTIIISKVKPSGPGGIGGGSSPTSTTSQGDCAASTVTVTVAKETVTIPASTVTVTVGASASCTADQEPVATQPPYNDKTSSQNSAEPNASSNCAEPTATVAPYPSGNGTYPYGTGNYPTSGRAKPTGFARLHR